MPRDWRLIDEQQSSFLSFNTQHTHCVEWGQGVSRNSLREVEIGPDGLRPLGKEQRLAMCRANIHRNIGNKKGGLGEYTCIVGHPLAGVEEQ